MKEYKKLAKAFRELLDAPHQRHFAVRFNDEENVAFNKMKDLLHKIESNEDKDN